MPMRSTRWNRGGPPYGRVLPVVTGALMLALGLSGCGKGTYLVVNFAAGTPLPAIYGIRVALTLSPGSGPTRQSTDTLPSLSNTAVLVLPTSAAFKLNDDSGALDIAADALDIRRESIAKGSVHTTIQHAQTWTLTLTLGGAQALSAQPLELAPVPPATEVEQVELEGRAQDPTWSLPSP